MAVLEVFYCAPSPANENEINDEDDDEILFCRSVDSVDLGDETEDAPKHIESSLIVPITVSNTNDSPIRPELPHELLPHKVFLNSGDRLQDEKHKSIMSVSRKYTYHIMFVAILAIVSYFSLSFPFQEFCSKVTGMFSYNFIINGKGDIEFLALMDTQTCDTTTLTKMAECISCFSGGLASLFITKVHIGLYTIYIIHSKLLHNIVAGTDLLIQNIFSPILFVLDIFRTAVKDMQELAFRTMLLSLK